MSSVKCDLLNRRERVSFCNGSFIDDDYEIEVMFQVHSERLLKSWHSRGQKKVGICIHFHVPSFHLASFLLAVKPFDEVPLEKAHDL